MCVWCDEDKIQDLKSYREKSWWDMDKTNNMVYDAESNEYGLWVQCEDDYYSRVEFSNIKFCPYCGRKLK